MKSDKRNVLIFSSIVIVLAILVGVPFFIYGSKENKMTNSCDSVNYTKTGINPIAKMSTTSGCIVVELYQSDAPKTVENFIGLAEQGYYNNLTFHRTVKDFVIQGGDPNGDGTGGKSFFGDKFADELNQNTNSYKAGYVKGVLAMANSGPNTNGSQFFIDVADLTSSLPKNYTIFGKVVQGQDVVDAISTAPAVDNGQGEVSKPVTPVKITKIEVLK